jgi:hypothetical protein
MALAGNHLQDVPAVVLVPNLRCNACAYWSLHVFITYSSASDMLEFRPATV